THQLPTFVFFLQAEDGIRARNVTGVQTCALPICPRPRRLQGDVTRMTTELITDPTETPTTAPAEATTEDASPAPSPTRGSIVKLTAASARVAVRPLDVDRDTARVHEGLSHPRAHHWMMTDLHEAGVRAYLEGIRDSAEEAGWVGSVDGTDCFYVETYIPDSLIPQNVLATGPGDIGMHLLVAPPAGRAMHGLTDRIMAEV